MSQEVTGFQAGLSGKVQIRIAMETILAHGGMATMPQIYKAIEAHTKGRKLSSQGRNSLRTYINRTAVNDGYIHPHNPNNPGWRATKKGIEIFSQTPNSALELTNGDDLHSEERTFLGELDEPLDGELERSTEELEEESAALFASVTLRSPLDLQPPYPLEVLAAETFLPDVLLLEWLRGIERKGQAILFGPPGTGKTFVAERLARHLVAETDGLVETVQFHPAYAYEDFVQGLRPRARPDGGLDYPLVPGRFLDFCAHARNRRGPCILIIDEINRTNLARVFGELMYLLEYRDREIPLAGGNRFGIPTNVRLLGTMNTADRSISLVDHALRRRFAFLGLRPQYEALRRFHEVRRVNVEGLVELLGRVNAAVADASHAVGTSFFMRPALEAELQEIWQLEIEPYLEEFFYDRPDRVEAFRWESLDKKGLIAPCGPDIPSGS